jgi:hypothetical protein
MQPCGYPEEAQRGPRCLSRKPDSQWWTADAKVEEKTDGKAGCGFEKRATVFGLYTDELSENR